MSYATVAVPVTTPCSTSVRSGETVSKISTTSPALSSPASESELSARLAVDELRLARRDGVDRPDHFGIVLGPCGNPGRDSVGFADSDGTEVGLVHRLVGLSADTVLLTLVQM